MEKISYKELFIESLEEINKRKWAIFLLALIFVLVPYWVLGGIFAKISFFQNMLFGVATYSSIILGIVLFFMYVIFDTFVVYLLRPDEEFRRLTFSEVINGGSRYLWKTIVLALILFFVLVPSYLFFVVPGLILTVHWIFSKYIIIIEQGRMKDSLVDSKKIIKKRGWQIFHYICCTVLMLAIIPVLLFISFNLLSNIMMYYRFMFILLAFIKILLEIYLIFSGVFMTAFLKRLYLSTKISGEEDPY